MRNSKKYKNGKTKLNHKEKFKIQFEDFTENDKKIYKKRIAVENMYASYKNSNKRFNIREDKYIKNLEGLTYMYFSEKILEKLKQPKIQNIFTRNNFNAKNLYIY